MMDDLGQIMHSGHTEMLVEETFKHRGVRPADLRKAVLAREAEIVSELGPVIRSHRFEGDGSDCIFIWQRK